MSTFINQELTSELWFSDHLRSLSIDFKFTSKFSSFDFNCNWDFLLFDLKLTLCFILCSKITSRTFFCRNKTHILSFVLWFKLTSGISISELILTPVVLYHDPNSPQKFSISDFKLTSEIVDTISGVSLSDLNLNKIVLTKKHKTTTYL